MNNQKEMKDSDEMKQRDNFIKQQQQLKAMKPTTTNKVLSADSMIEDLLSKKETFQKKKDLPSKSEGGGGVVPHWLKCDSNRSSIDPLYKEIWNKVKVVQSSSAAMGQTHYDLADTALVSTLLMTSGLSTDVLGFIWSLANNTVPGTLTQHELYSVLALVALAQSGYIFNSVAVLNQIPQPPIPNLDLSVLAQVKSSFSAALSMNMQPAISACVPSPVADPIGGLFSPSNTIIASSNGYFVSPSVVAKSTSSNSIVSLDVNNLRSAPVLTLPNNFHSGSAGVSSNLQSVSQNFSHLLQSSSTHLEPQNLTVTQMPQSCNMVTPVQNLNNAPTPVTLSAASTSSNFSSIPSISLGISLPQSAGFLNQQTSHDALNGCVGTPGILSNSSVSLPLDNKENFSNSLESTSSSTAVVTNVGSILSKLSTNLNLSDVKKDNIFKSKVDADDSDNIDESFDSLSTERASTYVSSSTNSASDRSVLPNKPNYNIDLFDSFSDVKPIFPNSSSNNVIVTNSKKNLNHGEDTIVITHNPIYQNDDDVDVLSQPKLVNNTDLTLSKNDENFDDDFTDFQSADFDTFNKDIGIPSISRSKLDDDNEDNFTDFQQASCPVDASNKSLFANPKSFQTNDADSDHDFLPGLKFDNLSISLNSESLLYSNKKEMSVGLSSLSDQSQVSQESASTLSDHKDTNTTFGFNNSLISSPVDADLSSKGDYSLGEDRYSALRMLEIYSPVFCDDDDVNNKPGDNVNDDFGDFIAANPNSETSQLQLPVISTASPDNSVDDSSIQVKCLEACLDILQKSYDILTSASSPQVLNQVLSDPRGSAHLACLLEVYKVSERLVQNVDNSALVAQVQTIWNTILPYVDGTKHKQMEESVGPVCGICKCNSGPSPVRYGLSTYHSPCANLYLHYVNPVLPTVSN